MATSKKDKNIELLVGRRSWARVQVLLEILENEKLHPSSTSTLTAMKT